MYRVGLTGGIASGKSTVAAILRQLGAFVIDSDKIAREIVEPGQPAYVDIVRHFGKEMLLPDGSVNRPFLAAKIFKDEKARLLLNELTHPRVIRRIESLMESLKTRRSISRVVIDIPLLVEANMMDFVDEIWLAFVDRDTQLQRLLIRDALSVEEAEARLGAQMPLADKRRYAHHIIDNNGSIEATRKQIERLWSRGSLD